MVNSKEIQDEVKKRLFIGIKIVPSEELLNIFNSARSILKNSHIKWTNPENFHITLRFLGHTPTTNIKLLNKAIADSISGCQNFRLELKSIGTFGKDKPKILWIGITENHELRNIHNRVNTSLEEIGYEFKDNIFHPHVTLGRIKKLESISALNEIQTKLSDKITQEVLISEISLYESVVKGNGPDYNILSAHKLR